RHIVWSNGNPWTNSRGSPSPRTATASSASPACTRIERARLTSLAQGERKRVPEHDPTKSAAGELRDRSEGLGAVGGIEHEPVRRNETTGRVARGSGMPVPGAHPPDGTQRRAPGRHAARQARSGASGKPAGERARTTSAARAAHAVATARLASVSGCGNWARTVRAPSAPAWTVVARQWLEPVPPAVRYTTSAGAGPSRNSSPRTLLPPQRREDRSSRLSQSAAAPHAAASPGADSSGVGQSPRLPGASAPRI